MNATCRKYLSEVKSCFPLMGRREKRYLRNLSKAIEDYCETEQVSSWDDICKEFGQPQFIAASYLETVDATFIIKKIRLAKWIRCGILFLLMSSFTAVSIYGIAAYKTYQAFQQEQVFFEKETIGSAEKESSDMQTKITTIDSGDFLEIIISDVPAENGDIHQNENR